ncbi:MAG TPA: hypothetical protein VGP18_05920 [Solirubrobacteraceae bacterium]|jgi:hypothetical protein|nr:hypothetical protein [Solirubrobacteraceae bacterium]
MQRKDHHLSAHVTTITTEPGLVIPIALPKPAEHSKTLAPSCGQLIEVERRPDSVAESRLLAIKHYPNNMVGQPRHLWIWTCTREDLGVARGDYLSMLTVRDVGSRPLSPMV